MTGSFHVGRAALLALLLIAPAQTGHAAERLAFRHQSLDLPGAPAAVISADLNADGRRDLLVVVARTFWGEMGTDRIEGLVQISEVVPALMDQREAHAFLQGPDGLLQRIAGGPLPLPPSILSLEAGPPSHPVLALTDDGISSLVVGEDGGSSINPLEPSSPQGILYLAFTPPLITDRPVLSGSRTLLSHLDMARDIDGDATLDLLLPSRDGLAVYRGVAAGFDSSASARLTLPGDERRSGTRATRRFPLPRVEDVDGDRLADLVVVDRRTGEPAVLVLRGLGEGRFSPPKRIDLAPLGGSARIATSSPGHAQKKDGKDDDHEGDEDDEGLVSFGDLDGDGVAEAVAKTSIDTGKGDLKQAKEPHYRYRFHRVSRELVVEPAPYYQMEVVGHGFDVDLGEWKVNQFQDLDGDGRKDLVTISLDFSLFQIMRVMATKRIGLGLDFHVWNQQPNGSFLPVPKLDLSETLRFDLNDLKLERLAQFAGDFDGDGRADFVHLGRGKNVTIHRGQPGCRYPSGADLTLPLQEEILDLGLVRVVDLDADGRSDLAITRPLESDDPGASAPTRLELYLSGGAR